MYVCPDSCIDTIPSRASREEHTAYGVGIRSKPRIYGVSNQTWLIIISNIKCQLRDNLFGKNKPSQQNTIQKAVLKNFAIFTGKHLCWSCFLIS